MPQVVVVSPTGLFVFDNVENENDLRKHLHVKELCQDPEISKYTFKRISAHHQCDLNMDTCYVSHALTKSHPDSTCSLPLHPLRKHLLEWYPHEVRFDPKMDSDDFRGPIVITKEHHFPYPNMDNITKHFKDNFRVAKNHDPKPQLVDMTEEDLQQIRNAFFRPNKHTYKCCLVL